MAKSPVRTVKHLLTRPIRLPRLTPYVPAPDDPTIFWFNSERDDIIREVTRRCVERHVHEQRPLEYVLNEVAHEEVKRLESQRDDEARDSLGFWRGTMRRVGRMSESEKKETLRLICERMAWDIAGNFDPRIYQFATRAVPPLLTGVMKPSALPEDLMTMASGTHVVDEMLRTEGDIDRLKRLAKRGTLVFVPTHSSNLDSIALGYALMREGLPPVVYGAGKNLFTNPIISFFMHNLGAYRVDRRIRAALYKDVLKTYSCVMIERGYHSLFFPGGTRSRSGMLERKLKLGLAGTAIEAFSRNRVRGIARPVFFVPTTINYGLVLEAETLVEDWLKEAGKARYIIEDDEFSQLDRWLAFFRRVAQMESACVIRFGRPLDPFGNAVDDDGGSLTPDGRVIDPGTYVQFRGVPTIEPRRDAEYTREMGQVLVGEFERDTVLMSTQIVAHALFRRLVRATPGVDLFGRLRHRGEVTVRRDDLAREVGQMRERLRDLASRGEVHLSELADRGDATTLIDRVFAAWNGYHRRTIVIEHDGQITAEDPTMLLYYQNRLVPYAERVAGEGDLAAAREIARLG
ncbi:1-acyl-sn-glycerol-3-phosphate acyltransferase [Sandaracinus amylolyticus]|uniref:1-acyl-sn-glycerol-3-phosphate acyltransferase n=1 Tax=Sandaracinus amylolyticus TaxID=927083 RepID=UPI00146FE0CC|nr:1-acyl-sn-glycerol-3-phosphate acyltransferase [Sandaracinus amylolyticus]